MPVHPAASQGFAANSAVYAKGRPDYPPEVAEWLRGDLALGESKVALDLGSGTGKFLPCLVATGAAVIAVEPIAAMRAQLLEGNLGIAAKAGSAEDIPLGDSAVDAVICAQSFHWFANSEAIAEIRRVLKPGGCFGLIWNVRDERAGWVAPFTEIIEPYAGDAPRYNTQDWRRLFPAEGFTPLVERHFQHHHTGSPERVIVDRALSISFIAALPAAEQNQVAVKIRDLIASSPDLAGKSEVTVPYVTSMFSCRKLG